MVADAALPFAVVTRSPRFARALVVANPIAGRGAGRARATELVEALTTAGVETELFLTAGAGDATRRVAELDPAVELVVSVGGDGTLGEVLTSLPPEVPVAVLPDGDRKRHGDRPEAAA